MELQSGAIKHGDLYKLKVRWNGGEGERIPAWALAEAQKWYERAAELGNEDALANVERVREKLNTKKK